jgi:hypothetical protein
MALLPTTGPSPGRNVWTCVSVTLKGAAILTRGAAVSVDPVTPALPVVPVNVHSEAPSFDGAAVGHEPAAAAFSSTDEPHADSVSAEDAAQTANTTEADLRDKFTAATLQAAYQMA